MKRGNPSPTRAPSAVRRGQNAIEAFSRATRSAFVQGWFALCVLALSLAVGCGSDGGAGPNSSVGGGGARNGGAAGNVSSGGAAGSGGAGATSTGGVLPTAGTGMTAGAGAGGSGGDSGSGGGGNGGGGNGGGGNGGGGNGGGGNGGGGSGGAPDPSEVKAAYVYGSVSEDGTIPAPAGQEYDAMRLNDTGATGCSEYKMEIEAMGYSITEVYDRTTTFDSAFLSQYHVIIFGNHQKVMSDAEQDAIATWVAGGGGLLAYSDSAFGGKYDVVGISNTVGQQAVNSIIGQFGMQVLTDQGNGTCAMKAPDDEPNPVTFLNGKSLVLEGEGESPVCVDPNAGVRILIPFSNTAKVGQSGSVSTNNVGGGMTIESPLYAALAVKEHGKGRVVAQFDRQMMWNNGPGSSIAQKDNREIQKRIFLFLAHAL